MSSVSSPADNYWPEPCASCNGTGKYPGRILSDQLNLEALSAQHREAVAEQIADLSANCVVCGGQAFVLVLQPPRKCRQCGGGGRSLAMRCLHCKGTGWMFVQKEQSDFLR
jgi:DnaJ-class molecular chaperone